MNDTIVLVAPMGSAPDRPFLEALGPVFAHWGDEHGHLLVYTDQAGAASAQALLPEASRHALIPKLSIAGASPDAVPTHHYVVWTDTTPGWEAELADWYEQEHLPGLATVPGAVHARRFAQVGDGPASYACYDVTAPEVLGSPPWLKVRATDWSSRVRPNFTNTRRWMSRTLRTPQGFVA
jgi:hypothetical protein